MLVGYARVSTLDQNLDLQRDALRKAGCERLFEEKKSGKAIAADDDQNVTGGEAVNYTLECSAIGTGAAGGLLKDLGAALGSQPLDLRRKALVVGGDPCVAVEHGAIKHRDRARRKKLDLSSLASVHNPRFMHDVIKSRNG